MQVLNYAHRGDSGHQLENTLQAFQSAYDKGADGAELDIQWTRDHEIVVFHDFNLDRLTHGQGLLRRKTLKELKDLTFKVNDQAKILTLEEYLQWARDKAFKTNIELKMSAPLMEDRLIHLLDLYTDKEDIIISSFNPSHLESLRRRDEDLQCAYLFDSTTLADIGMDDSLINLKSLFEYLHAWRIEYIHPEFFLVHADLLALADIYQLKINSWTVNDEDDLQHMVDQDIHGIITDEPGKLAALLKEKAEFSSL